MRMYSPVSGGKPIHIFTVGAFGACVASRLRTLLTDVIVTACDTATGGRHPPLEQRRTSGGTSRISVSRPEQASGGRPN